MSASTILLEIAVKTSLVLVLALVVTALMARRASAGARHVVWVAAMIATLLLPLLVWLGPTWQLAPLPDWTARMRHVVSSSAPRARVESDVWPAVAPNGSHAPMVTEPGRASDAPGASSQIETSFGASWLAWSALPALAVRVWAVGVLIALGSLAAGLLWAAWFARRATPILTSEWRSIANDAVARMGVTGRVRWLMSPHVGIPVACGIVRPAILFPTKAAEWTLERRSVVMLHELAHVQRRDCLVQALAHFAWALHWYNPLALLAISRLRAEQERACDDLVLKAGTPAPDYADHLCDIASGARRPLVPMWATLAIARPSRLEARVTAILDDTRQRQRPSRRFCAAVVVAIAACVVPLAAVHGSVAAQAIAILPARGPAAVAAYSSLVPGFNPGGVSREIPSPSDVVLDPVLALPARAPVQAVTAENGRAFLGACLTCHNSTRRTANLSFDELAVDRPGDNPEIWEKVVRRLRTRLHPPATMPRPDPAAADAFSASIEAALDRADQNNWSAERAVPLNDAELANRLAKFLWNSDPDAALLKAASGGKLREPARLREQVVRMLADKRSDALLTGFFGSWLHLKNLPNVKPDPALFPDFDALRDSFRQETALFLASQVRDDHPLTDLLTANYSFLNDRLAAHYGIAGVSGSQFRRVTLPNDVRAGLLGQGSVLSVTSYATRTSPVARGKWVMIEWLGVPPPDPPANVPALPAANPDRPATLRNRMEQHRKNPACASCHTSMDAIGFSLENFDLVGRWRTTEEGLPIDASGVLPDGTTFDGPAALRAALMDRRDAITSTITLKLLAYALGRPARFSDMPVVRTVLWNATPRNHTWSAVILGVVQSQPFQTRRAD